MVLDIILVVVAIIVAIILIIIICHKLIILVFVYLSVFMEIRIYKSFDLRRANMPLFCVRVSDLDTFLSRSVSMFIVLFMVLVLLLNF